MWSTDGVAAQLGQGCVGRGPPVPSTGPWGSAVRSPVPEGYYFPEQDVTFVLWFNASSLQPTEANVAAVLDEQRDRLRDVALGLEAAPL